MAISTIGASGLDSTVSQIGKNILHNGAMTVAQRGTSEASVFGSASGYGAWPDGFRAERASGSESGRATFSQDSSGPAGFANCLKVLETTSDASPSAGDYYRVTTRIEAQNLQRLAYGNAAAKSITLSFYVFCNLTGAFTVTFGQNDTTRMYSTTYTVDSTNTWEKKTITIPGDASGVINDDTGIGLEIGFFLGGGSNFTGGTQGSWASNNNNMIGAGMTNNVLGSSSGDWRITGLQLEVGSVATDFEHEPVSVTLAKCQRYFWRWKIQDANSQLFAAPTMNSATNAFFGPVNMPVEMRVAPTGSISNVGHVVVADGGNANRAVSAVTFYPNKNAATIQFTVASGTAGGAYAYRDGPADALFFDFTAEL
jgi:hypothetical protein